MGNKSWYLIAAMAFVAGVGIQLINQTDFTDNLGDQYQWREVQQKPVVINFFAEWCAPCLREIPELNKFAEQHPNINMFGVSFDPMDQQQLSALHEKYDFTFPLIADPQQAELPVDWPSALPTTYVISPDGQVTRLLGEVDEQKLSSALQRLARP